MIKIYPTVIFVPKPTYGLFFFRFEFDEMSDRLRYQVVHYLWYYRCHAIGASFQSYGISCIFIQLTDHKIDIRVTNNADLF